MFRSTVLLCTIAVQVLSAPNPNGCTESCTTYHSPRISEALAQQESAALNNLGQLPLDYTRPGNWTEHNEYRTDGGAGRVSEEKGQIVTGPRRVQYYKKKYSSSSHGVSPGDARSPTYGDVAQSILESQSMIGSASGLESVGHRSAYDEEHRRRIHQSSNSGNIRSGRLEDFSDRVDDSQVLQHGQSPTASNGGNWHTSNSWRTDGGRGVVHEEQGQVVDGSAHMKYYRKNYSTSYSSGDAGVGLPSLTQPNLEAEIQRLQQQFDSFGREIHRSTVGQNSLDVGQTAEHTGYVDEGHLTASSVQRQRPLPATSYESTHNEHRATTHRGVVARPSSRNYQRTTETQYHETGTQGADYSNPQNSQTEDHRAGLTSQRLYVIPARPLETVQSSEAHQVYQKTVAPQRPIAHSVVSELQHHETGAQGADFSNPQNSQIEDIRAGRTSQQLYVMPARPLATVQSSEAHQEYQETVASQRPLVHNVGNVRPVDRANDHLIRVPIHTSADYRSFHADGRDYRNSQMTEAQIQQSLDDLRRASSQHQTVNQHGINRHSGYTDDNAEILSVAGQPGVINRVEEHWSASGHRSASTVPQPMAGSQLVHGYHANYVRSGQSGSQPGSYNSLKLENVHGQRVPGSSFNDGLTTSTAQYTIQGLPTSGCGVGKEETEGFRGTLTAQRKYKRDIGRGYNRRHSGDYQQSQDLPQQTEDLTQQSGAFDDYTQQISGKLEFGQQQQQAHSGKLKYDQDTQQTEDLTQQTSGFGDYTQQQSGKLEFGQHSQQTEDLTQQTSGFGDYTQQQSGKLEFGQQSQQPEDLTQQTSGFGDYTQQQSGKLEFGQQSQQPEDLTQQTSGFGDYTQQHSGKLEFGQQSQQPEDLTQQTTSGFGDHTQQHSGKLEFGQQSQQPEDLTQQTSGFGDYTQQQSGKLEFGQQSQQPEDLTQQTSGFGDYTQQQSGKLEFGQQSQQPEDLTQQTTSGFGDHTQQHSGKLEFGQQSQQPEDLTQQTSGFGDYTQQQSGKLEFGQQSQQPEDLTQQTTSGFGDHTQQQSGKLEFGQQSQQPEDLTQQTTSGFGDHTQQHSGKLEFGQQSQQPEDLTQQTSGFGDYTQQQSGKLEFGQHSQQPEDLTQQTSGFGDYTQQQSGKLEFGQHSQHPEDLTQQTSSVGDYTQQQSGKIEFGQHHQQTADITQQTSGFGVNTQQTAENLQSGQPKPRPGTLDFDNQKPGSWTDAHIAVGHQETEDLTQQTEDLTQQTADLTQQTADLTQQTGDLTQQTSGFDDYNHHPSGIRVVGKRDEQHNGQLEFGQQSQHSEDLTQQTSGFGDYTQQQSGKLEFGQQNEQPDDLTQQTSGFGDYTQQQSGKLEFGQHSQRPEDLTQQTSGFGDYTQQQSGKLEFGQHSQQPDDLTQQTSGFGDNTQQSGKLEFGQHSQRPEDLTQQTSGFGDYTQQLGKLEFGQHSQEPEDLTQQTSGFGDYTQQSGKLEFGHHSQRPEDLTQQTSGFGDYTQQSGKLEFGQHSQQPEDLTQQTSGFGDYTQQSGKLEFGQHSQQPEDLTQQTSGFGDYTQQLGKLEFGQHSQQPDDLTQQTSGFGDYTQQSGKLEFGQHSQQPEDLTQQTSGFGDYTQQTSGNLGFGQQQQQHQQHSGHLEFGQHTQQADDLTQQTSGFGDYTQQTSGNLQFGQQHEQQAGKLEFGQPMQHPFNHPAQDLSQQTQQSGFGDYTQQTSGNLQFGQQQHTGTIEFGEETTTAIPRKSQNTGVKGGRPRRPAPKPTLKHRQRRPHSDTEAGDTVIPSMNNSPFDVQPESDFDSVSRPKNTGNARQENLPSVQSLEEQELAANRASPLMNNPSAQWHMSHNPGDLTNSENLEIQQTTHGVDEQFKKKSYKSRDNSALPETRQSRQDSSVQDRNDSEPKLEPRIIEAYGGNGAYDVEHTDDIFGKAKVNPSATLAPNADSSEDPWDIRDRPIERPIEPHVEKPIERPVERPVEELDPSRITFPTDAPEVSTTPSSFWGRLGHKLSTTYEKAKEKATSIFGK